MLCYTTVSETIMGHVIVEQAPPDSYDARDTCVLYIVEQIRVEQRETERNSREAG